METLILSGAGVKGIYYVGIYKSLLEHNIINYDNLKHIISCSSGCIFGLCILLNYSIDFIEIILNKLEFNSFLDYGDLDDIFNKNGLFKFDGISNFLRLLIYHKYKCEDITLKEFYDKTEKEFIIKVYNYTDKKDEYISYLTNPDLQVITAISMSCSIPFFFKQIEYNGKLYIDGGITGSTPEINDDKYNNKISIKINSNNKYDKDCEDEDFISYITNIISIGIKKKTPISIYDIRIPCIKNISLTDFHITSDDKKEMIEHSKLLTDIHIYKYL